MTVFQTTAETRLRAVASRRSPLVLVACLMLAVAAALPVITTTWPPLLDYANHMARMHILLDAGRSPFLAKFYAIRWLPLPDLGMDVVIPALASVLPLAWAGRAFILLTMALMLGGTLAIHRALHPEDWAVGTPWWPWLGLLFLYDHILLMGFLNYLFGLGLALCGFAVWLNQREAPVLRRLAIGTALATATYFAHLFAFGIYGLLIAGFELQQALHDRLRRAALLRLAAAALQFALPLALLAVYATILRQHAATAEGGIGFGKFIRKFDLIFSVFDNYSRPFDILCFIAAGGLLSLAAWRRWLHFSPALALPVSLLAVAHFAMPTAVVTAYSVDRRMPVAIALLLIAASRPAAWRPRAQVAVASAIALVFVARMALIEVNWRKADATYAGWSDVLDVLPMGARLALAYQPDALRMAPGTYPVVHFPLIEVARRDAFVPTLFALPTQQPVQLREPYRTLAWHSQPETLWRWLVEEPGAVPPEVAAALQQYDYVLFVSHAPFRVRDDAPLEAVHQEPSFQLFQVRPPA